MRGLPNISPFFSCCWLVCAPPTTLKAHRAGCKAHRAGCKAQSSPGLYTKHFVYEVHQRRTLITWAYFSLPCIVNHDLGGLCGRSNWYRFGKVQTYLKLKSHPRWFSSSARMHVASCPCESVSVAIPGGLVREGDSRSHMGAWSERIPRGGVAWGH